MNVYETIREAHALLPGQPAADGIEDPRWQAIIAIGEFVETEPQVVWEFVQIWGSHPQEDLRDAIATCLLEHLLEYHFSVIFPRVESLALSEPLFADMYLRCWKFGQAKEYTNARQFDQLSKRLEK